MLKSYSIEDYVADIRRVVFKNELEKKSERLCIVKVQV